MATEYPICYAFLGNIHAIIAGLPEESNAPNNAYI